MEKVVLILTLAVGLVIAIFVLNPSKQGASLVNPLTLQTPKKIFPSDTFLEYRDPSGFSFSYPDNLSIAKNEASADEYADLLLSSKDVSGSLTLRIADSKLTSLEQWSKLNTGTSQEVKLGNLKALEIQTSDRLLLGALDQGILFTIEVPKLEEEFWMKVYNKILTNFSFIVPEAAQGSTSSDDISFEGEEVVE